MEIRLKLDSVLNSFNRGKKDPSFPAMESYILTSRTKSTSFPLSSLEILAIS